jgi:hypothetical protein
MTIMRATRLRLLRILTLPALAVAAACGSSTEERGSSSSALTEPPFLCGAACRGLIHRTHGDVNGDGKADIMFLNIGDLPGAISNGDGSFAFKDMPVTGGDFGLYEGESDGIGAPVQAVLGDFNGDAFADMALTGGVNTGSGLWTSIPVAFAQPSESFNVVNSSGGSNTVLTQTARAPGTQVVASDVNGDFLDDLVIVNASGVAYGLSNGDGTFGEASPTAYAGGTNPAQMSTWAMTPGAKLVAGDFDGDGLGDFALVGGLTWGSVPVSFARAGNTSQIVNLVGGQDASFASWAAQPGVAVVTGDFDGDGKTDIALAGGVGWTTLPVAFSNGDGSFRVTNRAISDFESWASDEAADQRPVLLAGDFNGDGKSDLALGGGVGWTTIPVALSNGDGTFGAGGTPLNDSLQGFAWEAMTQFGVTALSASSAALPPPDDCAAISGVSASRVMGSEVNVTFTLSKDMIALVSAGLLGSTTPTTQSYVYRAGTSTVLLSGLRNITEYWARVAPLPPLWSNGISTCGPVPVQVPANVCGGDYETCCAGTCYNGDMCVPAGFPPAFAAGSPADGESMVDPWCSPTGSNNEPCIQGTTCRTGVCAGPGAIKVCRE